MKKLLSVLVFIVCIRFYASSTE